MMSLLADFFGWIMKGCYAVVPNYYVDIILFTLITKVLQFPLSLWCHRNSLTMVALMPETNRLKVKFWGDNDRIGEESAALFKREHYHPMLSLVPLAVQIVILMGFVDVIYRITKTDPTALLARIPVKDGGIAWLMPLCAGAAAWFLGYCQNRINPLQREQTRAQQMATNGISIAISLFLGCFVAFGVGLYWVFSNLFSILVQLACNWTMRPEKYINYRVLYRSKIDLRRMQESSRKNISKEDKKREKADYKRFFGIVNKHLVFYSESSGFYKYFKNIIAYLLEHSNIVIHYVTNDPHDQIFKIAETEPRIKPYYIGPTKIIPLMMKMDADMVVMTVPDLDKFHIKRSYVRKDIEYIYLVHGLTSMIMCTREGAYDNYDTLFLVGQHQVDEIRRCEEIYHTKKKNLIPCGYSMLDNLIADYEKMDKTPGKYKRILIAPSYQEGNILDSCLDTILQKISAPDRCITVRPHPQYLRRFPQRIEEILNHYKDKIGENLVFETDFSSNSTIYTSDLLLTDWSGIAYEFSFATEKPTLFINTPMKVINPNYKKTGMVPTDISFRDQVGVSLDPEKLEHIDEVVEDMLSNREKYASRIRELREKSVFNPGHAAEIGAKYILSSLLEKSKNKKR